MNKPKPSEMLIRNLAQKLKNLRQQRQLSQEQLAESSGLSLRTIQRIEAGQTTPRGDSVKRLAVTLQVLPEELTNEQPGKEKNFLTLLQLSQISFFIFPLLGVLLPLVIWLLKRDRIQQADQVAKKILNFQLSWNLAFFAFCTSLLANQVFSLGIKIPFFSLMSILVSLYAYNALLILLNSIRYYQAKSVQYGPVFAFFS